MVKYLLPPIQYREFDNNGDPLSGGKVYTYVAGTVSTPKTSWTDSSGSTPNTNPVILDAAGAADIWIDGTYKIKVTDANDVLIREEDNINNDQGAQGASGTFRMSIAGGTADAITAAYSPVITLADLTTVGFRAINTNATTTPTFAPDGLTAHTIVHHNGDALLAGDIITGGDYFVTYDSANTRWQLNVSSAQKGIVLKNALLGITLSAPDSIVTPYRLRLPAALGSGGFINYDSSGIGSFVSGTGALIFVSSTTISGSPVTVNIPGSTYKHILVLFTDVTGSGTLRMEASVNSGSSYQATTAKTLQGSGAAASSANPSPLDFLTLATGSGNQAYGQMMIYSGTSGASDQPRFSSSFIDSGLNVLLANGRWTTGGSAVITNLNVIGTTSLTGGIIKVYGILNS